MSIKFYPRDIGRWRNKYEFVYPNRPFEIFKDKNELIEFLAKNDVELNDKNYPLEFSNVKYNYGLETNVSTIIQWTVIGWIEELANNEYIDTNHSV